MNHAYLVEADEVVDDPGVIRINQFRELEAVFFWNDHWYRIPFFVLEDLLAEMIREPRIGNYELSVFLNRWKHGNSLWVEQPIELLKEALSGEMEGTEAYRMY